MLLERLCCAVMMCGYDVRLLECHWRSYSSRLLESFCCANVGVIMLYILSVGLQSEVAGARIVCGCRSVYDGRSYILKMLVLLQYTVVVVHIWCTNVGVSMMSRVIGRPQVVTCYRQDCSQMLLKVAYVVYRSAQSKCRSVRVVKDYC